MPIEESIKQFNNFLRSKGMKSIDYGCSTIYNVVCLNQDYAQSSRRANKSNFRNFRGQHWNKKHDKMESSRVESLLSIFHHQRHYIIPMSVFCTFCTFDLSFDLNVICESDAL